MGPARTLRASITWESQAHDIGKMAGEAIAVEMKKRGWKPEDSAACILTHYEDPGHRKRSDGETEALVAGGLPKERIFSIVQKEPIGLATGREAADACLSQHPDVKHWMIAGINDESVLGAVRSTEARSFSAANVIAVGIGGDASRRSLSRAAAHGHDCQRSHQPESRHGFETADLMYHWIRDGKEPPPVT